MIFFITLFFAVLTSILSFAMQEEQCARPRTREEKIEKWASKAAAFVKYHLLAPAALPEELAPFCPSPIPVHTKRLTDTMFLSLPAVQELRILDSKAEETQFWIAYGALGGDFVYYARRCGIAACVAAGANPNRYMLHVGITMQDFALVQLLLEHGANPNQRSYDDTALIIEARNKYLAKLLHSYDAKLHTDLLHHATERQYSPKLLAWYIKQGLDVNANKDNYFGTPLHSLTTWIDESAYSVEDISAKCTTLLDAGAKTNIKNKNGYTFIDRINRKAQENIAFADTQQKCSALTALALMHPNHPDNCTLQRR